MRKIVVSIIALLVSSMTLMAERVSPADAALVADHFMNAASSSSMQKAPAKRMVLKQAEMAEENRYYLYQNENGEGWVIIAADDAVSPVLAYSETGHFSTENMPANVRKWMSKYNHFIQKIEADGVTASEETAAQWQALRTSPRRAKGDAVVGPLIKTQWDQDSPYWDLCPGTGKNKAYVGCVATAMAQVMKYWQYPESCDGVDSYYCSDIGRTLQALPATTFDYSLMLNSYCHWDYGNSTLVQDTYTDAQAQEVAKLSRYCGQAVEMGYSPEGSGAYTYQQLAAMKEFGYRSTAQEVSKGGWYGGYSTTEWEQMIVDELIAGRPILYAANDPSAGGHAFICDGYSTDGKFHFNFGWYGTCDGWYVSTALNMTHRDGDYLQFNSGHEMLIGMEPPEGWEPPVPANLGDVNGDGDVNVNDVTVLINYILGKNPTPFVEANADVNGDEAINVNDVTLIINIILNV